MLSFMNSTSSPYRVITVCTGNICRSPMAELMLAAALEREGLDGLVEVDSAGTTGYEAGRPIDPRAARRLAAAQLPSENHVARQWDPRWFSERDLILALDIDHYAWLTEAAPGRDALQRSGCSAASIPPWPAGTGWTRASRTPGMAGTRISTPSGTRSTQPCPGSWTTSRPKPCGTLNCSGRHTENGTL